MLPAAANLPGGAAFPPAAGAFLPGVKAFLPGVKAFLPVAASIPCVAALRLRADDALLKRDAVNTERTTATANFAALLDELRERLDALDDLMPGLVGTPTSWLPTDSRVC